MSRSGDLRAVQCAVLVLLLAWRVQPRRRLPSARDRGLAIGDRTPSGRVGRRALRRARGEVRTVRQWAGWLVLRAARASARGFVPRRRRRSEHAAPFGPEGASPDDPLLLSRIGGVAMAVAVGLVFQPALAPILVAGAWMLPVFERRRARRRFEASIAQGLPEVVDLLLLALTSGANVSHALRVVARRSSGPLAEQLRHTLAEVGEGRRLSDALDDLPRRAGEAVRGLSTALTSSERYGVPLTDSLERLAADVRARRRRNAEERARKVPVKMLFPLVCCTLPAFGLLTIAPLIASALKSLRL